MNNATGPWINADEQLPDDGVCLVQYANGDFGIGYGELLKDMNRHTKASSMLHVVRWARIATAQDAAKTEWTSNRQARPEAAGGPGYNMTDTARKIIRENMGADGAYEDITTNKVVFSAAFGAAFGQFCADHATLGQVELYGVREDVVEICNNAWTILCELDADTEAQR